MDFLMDRLVWALGERRRLWPPDGSSSMACLGLLGWMHLTYSDPEQAVRQATAWMWLGGLLDLGAATSKPRSGKTGFDAEDPQAIEAYGVAVAVQVLQVHSPSRMAQWKASRDAQWGPEDIAMLMALGATHGGVMRDVLTGVVKSFEDGFSYIVPMFDGHVASDTSDRSSRPDGEPDALDGRGLGLVSLLNHAERRDVGPAEAAGDETPMPAS